MTSRRPLPSMLMVIALLVLGTTSCEQRPTASIAAVAATVNGTRITQADIAVAARATKGHQADRVSTDGSGVLEGLIEQELAYQKAVALGLDNDPGYRAELADLEAQVDAFKRRKLSELFFRKAVKERTPPGMAAIRQYFKDNESQLRTEFHVWQILRRDEKSIEKLRSEIAGGTPFEAVAGNLFPNLPNSGNKPWDLGYLKWHQVPATWRNTITALAVGETSGIIRGQNNRYWIVKLIDKRLDEEAGFEKYQAKIAEILNREGAGRIREQAIRTLRENAVIEYSKPEHENTLLSRSDGSRKNSL